MESTEFKSTKVISHIVFAATDAIYQRERDTHKMFLKLCIISSENSRSAVNYPELSPRFARCLSLPFKPLFIIYPPPLNHLNYFPYTLLEKLIEEFNTNVNSLPSKIILEGEEEGKQGGRRRRRRDGRVTDARGRAKSPDEPYGIYLVGRSRAGFRVSGVQETCAQKCLD